MIGYTRDDGDDRIDTPYSIPVPTLAEQQQAYSAMFGGPQGSTTAFTTDPRTNKIMLKKPDSAQATLYTPPENLILSYRDDKLYEKVDESNRFTKPAPETIAPGSRLRKTVSLKPFG